MPTSLNELDAAKPRGPKIFFFLVAVLGLAAGAWFMFGRDTDGPHGEPEDAARVVLVGVPQEVAQVLPQLGLEVETAELSALAERGIEDGAPEGASPVDAAMYWADHHGYGYVAFADPASVDFGTRPVSKDSADFNASHGFAVFSVGDFAVPTTKVTVDPRPATYAVPPYVELLRALFEQDKLAATLLAEDNLSIEAKPLYERVRPAIDVKGAYGLVDQRARAADKDFDESVVAEEEAEPRPLALRNSLEETRAWPLANNRVLLLVTAPTLVDPHTEDVEMKWNAESRAFVVDPTDGTRTPCGAPYDAWANVDVRVDRTGRALLVANAETMRYDAFTVSPEGTTCGFAAAGSLSTTSSRGALGATAKLARLTEDEEQPGGRLVDVIAPGSPYPVQWQLEGCTRSYGVDWLDETHVAALCEVKRHEPEATEAAEDDPDGPDGPTEIATQTSTETWVYLVDTSTGETFVLPWRNGLDHGRGFSVVPGPTPRFLARSWDGTLELGTLNATLAAVQSLAPEPSASGSPFADGSSVRVLPPTLLDVAVFNIDPSSGRPVVSPTGTHLSYTVDSGRRFAQNLAVLDLRTKKQTRVAINRWARHDRPAFTADGSRIVFQSEYSLRDGEGQLAQIALVP